MLPEKVTPGFDLYVDLYNAVMAFNHFLIGENKNPIIKINYREERGKFVLDLKDGDLKEAWHNFCTNPTNRVKLSHDPES